MAKYSQIEEIGVTSNNLWKVGQLNKQETQLSLTNLRDAFIGQSRSPNIVLFHMLDIVSYCAIVFKTIFHFKNVVAFKSGSEVTQGN